MLIKRFFTAGRVWRIPLLQELKSRGLISQVTNESLVCDHKDGRKMGIYLGADPTADSLHLGNLMPFMVLMHFYLHGHDVFPLIGGATGIVGDPSGRKSEREIMLAQQREENVLKISTQMRNIMHNCENVAQKYGAELPKCHGSIKLVNNKDWWTDVNMLWFLGTFGRHFRVNAMIARESVKQRLNSELGLGYNEFSYQILQAYDFYYLYNQYGCQGQIGGHDQWGNIVSGIDLINRLRDTKNDAEPFGLTVPLLLTPSGEKFGKSAGNAVFLSKERTSPYHMYQHLVQSPDEAIENYLKVFTFIPLPEIKGIMKQHMSRPEKRIAQHRLAAEVTELIHGSEMTTAAQIITGVMFGHEQRTDSMILEAFKSQDLSIPYARSKLIGKPWRKLLSELTGKSNSECQRLINSGSVYVGLQRTPVSSNNLADSDITVNGLLLVRIGKSEYHVLEATS